MNSSFMVTGIAPVAMAGMIFYLLGFETGPGPLFYVMATQDFPPELVNQGLSLSNILLYVLNIALSFTFPIITEAIGAGYTFVILCGFEVICMVYFGLSPVQRSCFEVDFIVRKKSLPVQDKPVAHSSVKSDITL